MTALSAVRNPPTHHTPRARVFGFLAVALLPFTCAADTAPALSAKLVIVGKPGTPSVEGAEQGIAEAKQQGEFLGQQFELAIVPTPDAVPTDGVAAILTTDSRGGASALAQRHQNVPVLNLAAQDDALRATCAPNLFHVIPSTSMLNDAVAQWRKQHPDAQVTARAWHPKFEKYAASQLNLRFEKRFKHPMDDMAWSGWAGVKLVTDLIAQIQNAAPATLVDALRTKLAFDGQKGSTMRFRANGQLSQPILLVAGDKIVGEAPVRGVADVDDLASLGISKCAP
jgi:ABC-type branched-subunit amino acid transport system substrate-binding protein